MRERARAYNGAGVRCVGKNRRLSFGTAAASAVRGACLAAAVLALSALGIQIGQGVAAVARDEITLAQMLSALGAWLRGG
jgi:hypothetical protein